MSAPRPNGNSARTHSSEAVLAAEARLVAAGRESTPYSAAVQADLLIGLTAGQADLVEHFAGSGTQLAVGVGAAGVGKSFAMARLVQAWQASGRKVIGLKNTKRAARGYRSFANCRLGLLLNHGLVRDDQATARIRTRRPRFVA